MTRPQAQVDAVRTLHEAGLSDRQVSVATGVPVNTIRAWRNWRSPGAHSRARCPRCGGAEHTGIDPHPRIYNYLLGLYLGDGCLRAWGTGWTLRVSLDAQYPGIINECSGAMETLRGRSPIVRSLNTFVNVESSWVGWPCLFPHHGPGRKHTRKITLASWQVERVKQHPGSLLRGLIHSDGWRGLNKVTVKGREYAYPRYQFSNRSDDIRRIFTNACDLLGIEWRQWTRYHVSVAKRESVALLDEHVGPKY